MSLTRPAWSVTIAAPGRGWSYTITQGDAPFGGDLEFVPPLVAGFAFEDDQLPAPIAPDSLQFRLFARNTAALPDMIEGDVLSFQLVRPGADAPIPYMRSVLRVTDLQAQLDRLPAVYVDVTAVDVLATFQGRRITATLPRQSVRARLERLAHAGMVTIDHDLPIDSGILAPLTLEERSAGQTAQEALNVDPWDVLRPADHTDASALRVVHLDPEARLEFAPSEFYIEAGRVTIGDRADLPPTNIYGPVLQAAWIDLSPTWRRGKESRTNKAIANGIENPDDVQPVTASAEHRNLVRLLGESTRTVDTHLWETDRLEQTARRALPQRADLSGAWAVDELTVDTERLTDAELDEIAPRFIPQLDGSGPAAAPATTIVTGIPADLSLGRVAGRITQAQFTIDGGDLTIVPRILPAVPRALDAVTYAQWRASHLRQTTYSSDDIDPAVTYAEAKLARIATPPGLYPSDETYPSDDLFPTEA